MKIGIIIGSMQAQSNSAKIGRYINKRANELGHETYTLDLGKTPLPMWGSESDQAGLEWRNRLDTLTTELTACSAFVVISPEYHGMVPAALKNFFLYFDSDVLGHKPAYLIGVSSGAGGAYPISELRMSSTKNNRLCYTPEHCIVRLADEVLNDEDDGSNDNTSDTRTRKRLDYGLAVLVEYAKALSAVRHSGVIDSASFRNGM